MKLKFLFLILIAFLFQGCFASHVEVEGFEKIQTTKDLKNGQKYLILYEMDYCTWCVKQKELFNEKLYTTRFPQFKYITVNRKENVYKEFISIKGMENFHNFFPSMYIIEKKNDKINVLEEYTGYTKDEVMDYTLRRNK